MKINEKCLLNIKFNIKRKYNKKKEGILVYDRLKLKKNYTKINAIIINKLQNNYKIQIVKDYKIHNIFKNEVYLCSYKLLKKCSEEIWEKFFKLKSFDNYDFEDIIDDNNILNENEENFILDNQIELIK